MCMSRTPNKPRRVRSARRRYPWMHGAVDAAVDRLTWPFRLGDHEPTCRWAAFARAVTLR